MLLVQFAVTDKVLTGVDTLSTNTVVILLGSIFRMPFF